MEELVLPAVDKKLGPDPWHLQLLPDQASLVSPQGGPPLEIPRERTEEMLHVASAGGRTVLLVKGPRKSFQFNLTPEQRQQLETWLGPPTYARLRSRLKHRFASSVLIGVVLMLLAIPIFFGDFDPVLFVLGLGLLVVGLLARFRPRRLLFLTDGVWMTLVCLRALWMVGFDGQPWYLLAPLLFLVPSIIVGLKDYRRFRGVRPDAPLPLGPQRAA